MRRLPLVVILDPIAQPPVYAPGGIMTGMVDVTLGLGELILQAKETIRVLEALGTFSLDISGTLADGHLGALGLPPAGALSCSHRNGFKLVPASGARPP